MRAHAGLTIFVCGVSGVGKTRMLEEAVRQIPGSVIWRASEIIGSARQISDPERLRTLPTDEILRSQALLIEGFATRRKAYPEELVLLDAHSVIDTPSGLLDIPIDVARALAPRGMVHVSDEVDRILQRRLSDKTRVRPQRTLAELAAYQERSMASCTRLGAALYIPVVEIRSGNTGALVQVIRELAHS